MKRTQVIDRLNAYQRFKAKAESLKGTELEMEAKEEARAKLNEIAVMIDSVRDGIGANVLYFRFVSGFNWDQTAETLGLSKSTVYRRYNAAISELASDAPDTE